MIAQKAGESHPLWDERFTEIELTMERLDYDKSALIETLITGQETFGYLPKDMLIYISDRLHVPMSQVYGVATFYDMFSLEAKKSTECIVCTGPSCTVAGSKAVLAEACRQAGVSEPGQTSADGRFSVKEANCLGLCDQGPAVLVNNKPQVNVSLKDVAAMLRGEAQTASIQVVGEPRVLTAQIGKIAPTDLDRHRSEGAFKALEKVLHEMTPEQVIEEVKESRLTGRGGASFQTGLKWEYARQAAGTPKYAVCNFDESEPGTFKDRILMEGDPFSVIEGLMISAYVTGAQKGYIFIRGEYPTASDIVQKALEKLYAAGLLDRGILDTEYDLDIEIRHNAGAYICGEETALFEAIEGKRGHPRSKPPYPTQYGLFGKPTVVNNVETLAVIPKLILHGGEWFRQWGTEESVGLKLFCLSGHVKQPGVVEVPLGLSVRELITRYGGGFDGEPQAVLIGGAAGGFLHPDDLDTLLTHENLRPFGVPVGSGAVMVFNQSVDLWEVLENLAHFFVHETCGLCSPCRLGTRQIYHILQKINQGFGMPADLKKLEELGEAVTKTCRCGLGMTAANPALTVLHNIRTVA
jgi:NADH-quinone oxidoreductase subunit F